MELNPGGDFVKDETTFFTEYDTPPVFSSDMNRGIYWLIIERSQ